MKDINCFAKNALFSLLKFYKYTVFFQITAEEYNIVLMVMIYLMYYLDPIQSGLVMEWLTVKWQLGIVTILK